ncbi:hypothetical protein V8F20_003006 [Naviculisporaceae sp. PSN 640]
MPSSRPIITTMALFNFLAIIPVTLGSGLVAAVPTSGPENMTPNLQTRGGFQFRFYLDSACDHGAPASSTAPPNDQVPYSGVTGGTCYSAPFGTDWQRLEIDLPLSGVITFCNIDCQGTGTVPQSFDGSHCYVGVPGCAIGSFKVI